jgi:hypothetical protein
MFPRPPLTHRQCSLVSDCNSGLCFCWHFSATYCLGLCQDFQDASVASGRTALIVSKSFDSQEASVMQLVWSYELNDPWSRDSQSSLGFPATAATLTSFPSFHLPTVYPFSTLCHQAFYTLLCSQVCLCDAGVNKSTMPPVLISLILLEEVCENSCSIWYVCEDCYWELLLSCHLDAKFRVFSCLIEFLFI